MIDQSLVASGFDTEILMGGRYVQYLLLTLVDTGSLELQVSTESPDLDITIHPPTDYERLYQVNLDAAPLPPPAAGSFESQILFAHESGAQVRTRLIIDVLERTTGQTLQNVFADLFLTFTLEQEFDDERLVDADLRVEVVHLELDPPLAFLLALLGLEPDDLLPAIKAHVDRSIDVGMVSRDGAVHASSSRRWTPAKVIRRRSVCT